MTVTERTRHELHEALVELMGSERAETLMEHLPPTGWGDVVTKEYLDLRLEAQEHRLVRALEEKSRQTLMAAMGMMFSQTAILVTLILATRA